MFGGLKLKPEYILKSLKGFGIDINTMLPQLENLIIKEADKIEEDTGKRVFLMATKDSPASVLVCLYVQETDGTLSEYKQFPFSKILDALQKDIKEHEYISTESDTAISERTTAPATAAERLPEPGAGDE